MIRETLCLLIDAVDIRKTELDYKRVIDDIHYTVWLDKSRSALYKRCYCIGDIEIYDKFGAAIDCYHDFPRYYII